MQYNGVGIRLITLHDYLTTNSKQFVEVISDPSLQPTHWGKDPPRLVFDPEALEKQISDAENPSAVFRRDKAPKWSGQYGRFLGYFTFNSPLSEKWYPEIFSWADSLAEVMQPIFGVCHPILPQKNAAIANTCVVVGHELGEYGLPWLGGRTYLGNEIVNRIGRDLLLSIVELVHESPWGITIDLLPKPWDVDPAVFLSRQKEVMEQLKQCGMFADYKNFMAPKQGTKWTPFEI